MAQRAGRMFEVARGFESSGINLPSRATKKAAGYDFEAAVDVTIEPLWKSAFGLVKRVVKGESNFTTDEIKKAFKPVFVQTGVKAFMQDDEMLGLFNRSSNPLKRFLLLANGVGVIDADYYGNEDNDGHIQFQFINFGLFPQHIVKGERIGQGVFTKFLLTSDDVPGGERSGGHGSTGQGGTN